MPGLKRLAVAGAGSFGLEVACRLIEHGIDVLVEKPIAAGEARRIATTTLFFEVNLVGLG